MRLAERHDLSSRVDCQRPCGTRKRSARDVSRQTRRRLRLYHLGFQKRENMRKLQLAGLLCLVLARGGLAQNSPAAFQLDQTMQRRYAAGDFNGTVLVARQGKVIYERAFGLANREWSVPNDLETKFEIGSMTKQFTAGAAVQCVKEGEHPPAGPP